MTAAVGPPPCGAVPVRKALAAHAAVCDAVAGLAEERKKLAERMATEAEVQEFAEASLDKLREALQGFKKVGRRQRKGSTIQAPIKQSRFGDGMAEIGVDAGVTDFYGSASCAERSVDAVRAALAGDVGRYFVCEGCGSGILRENGERHARRCARVSPEEAPEGRYKEMTAEWALEEAHKFAAKAPFIGMYTLESPLCYDVHRRMRAYSFQRDAEAYAPVASFACRLQSEIQALPKYQGTVFRAVDFRVNDILYSEGALVTMPHQASASEDPAVVKRFLGSRGGEKSGSVLILRTRSGRRIGEFSRFPEEKEVLIPTNAQFRVAHRPDVGLMQLLESALECELANVAVAELHEVAFEDWGGLRTILTDLERFHNEPVLDALDMWRHQNPDYDHYRRSKWTGARDHHLFPCTTEMPGVVEEGYGEGGGKKSLLEYAAVIPQNHAVVALMVANLDLALGGNKAAIARAFALAASLSDVQIPAALLAKGAVVPDLPEALRTCRLAHAAVLCSRAVVEEVKAALGAAFAQPNEERSGWTPVHAAADAGREDLLKEDGLIASAGDLGAVDAPDAKGEPPLFAAVRKGRAEVVRALLGVGASADYQLPHRHVDNEADLKSDKQSLRKLKGSGKVREFLKRLKESGKLRGSEVVLPPGGTACWAAARLDEPACLEALIAEGADMNLADVQGRTPMFIATHFGHLACVEVLVQHGADAARPQQDGLAPLHEACFKGHTGCARVLLDDAAVPIAPAAWYVLQMDGLASQHTNGWTPMHNAVGDAQAGALRVLMDRGAPRNPVNVLGDTPLFWGCATGNAHCVRLVLRDDEGKRGANIQNTAGLAPLHAAAAMGQLDCLRLLLRVDAVVRDAPASPGDRYEGVAEQPYWVCYGEEGWRPVHFAAAGGGVFRRRGASAQWCEESMGAHDACLMELLAPGGGGDAAARDAAGNTPLAVAARYGSTACVGLLLAAAPELVDAANAAGETPCQLAARGGHAACAAALKAAGADASKAASAAAREGHAEIAALLASPPVEPIGAV